MVAEITICIFVSSPSEYGRHRRDGMCSKRPNEYTKAPFTRERNGTERCGTVPENKGIFAGVHTRTTRNVPFRSEKWTALKSEP